jgi:carboxylesterase type B
VYCYSALAKNHSVVFISVNYRRGILGFLSLDALSKRAYPQTSGNYGLGDVIAALQWIKLNVHQVRTSLKPLLLCPFTMW